MRATEPYTIFLRKLSSGKEIYYYQFRDDSGRRSSAYSTGTSKLSQAKRYCRKLYNEGKFRRGAGVKFSAFTDGFFSHDSEYYKWKIVNNERITDETLLSYNKFLRNQLLPYFSDFTLSAITRSDVKQWIIWCSDKWSAKTINNAQTTMNIIMKQAVEKNIISFNPLDNLRFRKTEKKQREILTVDEVRKIYSSDEWKSPMFRQIFLLDAVTGMRISEIMALKNDDVKDGYLNVAHSYSRKFGLGDTKTHSARYVPVPRGIQLRSETEYLFEDKGKPLNINRIYNAMLLICRKLRIDCKARKITVHTLRNFFISYLQSENVSEAKIRAVVGHKDSTMTGLYTYWKPDMFPEIYKAQEKLYKEITNGKN